MTRWLRFFGFGLCVVATACSDYFGSGPDPAKAGLSDGTRIAVLIQNMYVNAIVVDDTRLFVMGGPGMLSFAKNGTDQQLLANYQGGGGMLAQWKDVLFVRGPGGGIVEIPKAGGQPTPFVPSSLAPSNGSMVADASGLYYVSGGGVYRAPFGGGTPTQLVNDASGDGPNGATLAVDAVNVYYTANVFSGGGPSTTAVKAISKANWSATVIASSTGRIFALCAANGVVYYVDTASGASTGGSLSSVDPRTQLVTVLDASIVTNGGGGNAFLFADSTGVYGSAGMGILHLAFDGGGTQYVVQNSNASSLAIDDSWIYWVDQNSNGWVFKIRK